MAPRDDVPSPRSRSLRTRFQETSMQSAASFATSPSAAIDVSPSAGEVPLRVVVFVIAIVLWILFIVSVVGLVYGLILGLFFFFAHLMLIAHVRGSSVKLGPQQMPEIYDRVVRIAHRIGM